jgi:hypothetical protein
MALFGRKKEQTFLSITTRTPEGGIPPVPANALAERAEYLSNMYAAMRAKALGSEA